MRYEVWRYEWAARIPGCPLLFLGELEVTICDFKLYFYVSNKHKYTMSELRIIQQKIFEIRGKQGFLIKIKNSILVAELLTDA